MKDQSSSVAESAAQGTTALGSDNSVRRWRKRPVVIEAWQFNGSGPAAWSEAPDWLADVERVYGVEKPGEVRRAGEKLEIYTLEGIHTANRGDWIIRGVQGELYPCRPDIFAATYEPADPGRDQ